MGVNSQPIFISGDQDKSSQAAFLNENFRRLNDELSIENFDGNQIALGNNVPTDVGSPTAAYSHGVLIDDTGIYACTDGQTATDANVRIKTDGTAYFAGEVSAGSGDIGGWNIGATSLTDDAGAVGLSSAVTAGDDVRFWAGGATPSIAPFYVTESGALKSDSATITGAVNATTGKFGSSTNYWNVGANGLTATSTDGNVMINYGKTGFGQDTTNGFILGYDFENSLPKFEIGSATDNMLSYNGSGLSVKGSIQAGLGSVIATTYLDGAVALANTDIASQGWVQTCTFTSTSATQVDWAAGTLTTADETVYSIDAGNTGFLSGRVYIYLDIVISQTVYQVTSDPTAAVGSNKILVATAINNTNGALFETFGNSNVDGSNITANSIVGDKIVANTIDATKLNVTSLAAVSANMGDITSGTITLDSAGHVKGGQTDYNTGTGFFLGHSGGQAKFSLGSATNSLTWNGNSLEIAGRISTTTPINLKTYTTATLPGQPADTTTNSPSANSNG